ncbi:unnamed protein product [Ixodes persulcatus]
MEDPPPPVTLWEAQYAYEARRPGEVSLLPGDLLEVPKGDQQGAPGWLLGTSRRTGQSGYFPASFRHPCKLRDAAANTAWSTSSS